MVFDDMYYVFFTLNALPAANTASMVQLVNCASAASEIGHRVVLVHFDKGVTSYNPLRWIFPWAVRPSSGSLCAFYGIGRGLNTVAFPAPWPVDRIPWLKISAAVLAKRLYLPKSVFPRASLFYSRDWNFIRLAVKSGIPSIFEWDFPVRERFDPDVVGSEYFRLAVANTDYIKKNMVEFGMPEEKVAHLHNGVNESFFNRDIESIVQVRSKWLSKGRKYLVVYAGGLHKFKGVDLLMDVAVKHSAVQFVIAGGNDHEVRQHRQAARSRGLDNVEFTGNLPNSRLVLFLQAADVLAYPHLSTADAMFTSPLKFFEYLASGSAIVSTDLPFLDEFKNKNIALVSCHPDDVEAFSSGLDRALRLFPWRQSGYLENLELARQCTWESRMRRILSIARMGD